jgi:tRNA1(Val) A37 N6-methylase TrmN6
MRSILTTAAVCNHFNVIYLPLRVLLLDLLKLQSRRGYRANTDSWVLAYLAWKTSQDCSSAPLSVLDLGSGHGLASVVFGLRSQRTASLCLIEFQQKLADRARRNMELNGICDADIRVHDVQYDLPPDLHGQADVVLCNPPFYVLNSRLPPTHEEKKLAHMETTAGISEFVRAAKTAVRIGGSIFVIYDMMNFERLLLACQNAKLFIVSVQEVYHRVGRSTGRVLLYAKKLEGEVSLATPWVAPTYLHSAEHEEPYYVPEIEDFFGEFPHPLYDIGRSEYVGSPKIL